MCKGPEEKGGPYRCSADASKEWSAAQQHYAEAAERVWETSERKVAADGSLARVSASIEAARLVEGDSERRHQLEVLEAARSKFEQECSSADAEHDQARKDLRAASRNAAEAQSDYDATPRGVADLQSALDATDQPDPGLVNRLSDALGRMTSDSALRDARWGSDSGVPVAIPRSTKDPGDARKSEYATLAAQDGLSASCVAHGYTTDRDSGREGNLYTVTFYRPDDGTKARYMRVRYLSPMEADPPTQADVLAAMSSKAADYEGHRNFPAYCRERSVPHNEREAARADWQEGKRYSRQLEGFLGDQRDSYLGLAKRLSTR